MNRPLKIFILVIGLFTLLQACGGSGSDADRSSGFGANFGPGEIEFDPGVKGAIDYSGAQTLQLEGDGFVEEVLVEVNGNLELREQLSLFPNQSNIPQIGDDYPELLIGHVPGQCSQQSFPTRTALLNELISSFGTEMFDSEGDGSVFGLFSSTAIYTTFGPMERNPFNHNLLVSTDRCVWALLQFNESLYGVMKITGLVSDDPGLFE